MSGTRCNGHTEGYATTQAADMRAFDLCPKVLRQAMRDAVGQWAAETILKSFEVTADVNHIIAFMHRGDLALTLLDYGPSHPEAARD